MKIKPSADFSAIPAESATQQVKSDALMMQAESALLFSAPETSAPYFVLLPQGEIFPELRKAVQSQIRKNSN